MEQQAVEPGFAGSSPGTLSKGVRQSSVALKPSLRHEDWRRELRGTILRRVVPRLTAHEAPSCGQNTAHLYAREAERFAVRALHASLGELLRHVDDMRACGLALEGVILNVLPPAARRLGDMWLADRLSFLDVTLALGRLQAVTRALGPEFEGAMRAESGRRVLLAPVPGEQHVFGISIVAAFFRRAGWHVTFEPSGAGLAHLMAAERFDVVGLSVGGDAAADRLPSLVGDLRRAARSHRVPIIAGGPAVMTGRCSEIQATADAVAGDASEAVRLAEALSARAVAA